MGYACPVCGAEQADDEHLANHVAFTAMLRSDEHEDWLDEHVPDWGDMDPDTLAPEVTPHATEIDVDVETDHGGRPQNFDDEVAQHGGYGRDTTSLGGDAQSVLTEAQELTRKMYGLDEEASTENGGDADTAANDSNADGATDATADADADSESE